MEEEKEDIPQSSSAADVQYSRWRRSPQLGPAKPVQTNVAAAAVSPAVSSPSGKASQEPGGAKLMPDTAHLFPMELPVYARRKRHQYCQRFLDLSAGITEVPTPAAHTHRGPALLFLKGKGWGLRTNHV